MVIFEMQLSCKIVSINQKFVFDRSDLFVQTGVETNAYVEAQFQKLE